MNLSEAVAISSSSLWTHKLRSVLTLIGVVIGVAAVIAVVSLPGGWPMPLLARKYSH